MLPPIQLLVREKLTLRKLANLIGILESSRPAIWRAPLHFRHLQINLIKDLQASQKNVRLLYIPMSKIQDRVGMVAHARQNQLQVVRTGSKNAYQLSRANGSVSSSTVLPESKNAHDHIVTNRQHESSHRLY